MSINNFYKLSLLIVIIVELISYGLCCTDVEWTCDSGQCIASDELCDGNTDCSDGSDETANVCIQQSCPSFAFRCAYGACVAGSAECNGIKDCADNSDESSSLCPDNVDTRNSLCQDEQFQCTSGECIDLDNACDGRSDCKDQSDETVEACASFNCPTFAFRCGYGACISKTKKCNGFPDCRDGSDETLKLCGQKPTPTPPTKTPPTIPGVPTQPTKRPPLTRPPPVKGCKAPIIPFSILKYEADPTKIISGGETIADGTSMVYECIAGYYREGPQFNLCFDSKWYSALDANCVKYCPYHKLKGVTFRAECQKDGASVSCDDRIRPGTYARLFCQHKYRKPARNPPDVLVCQDDGQWDYEPFRCEPVCGKELLLSTAFSVNGIETNITYVPWHAGIYQNFAGGRFKHVCGATIVSAKVVVTAAHCFWDFANQKVFDKSYYVIGAGKYLRDYYANERNAEFKNISEIAIPPDFNGEIDNYKSDIAVLVLTNFLKFSPYIAPACIDWKQAAAKAIGSNIYGQIPGWGIDNSGDFSKVLRTIDVPSSSYSDCRDAVGSELANAVSYDKFCVINTSGAVVCQGDSGGGFIVKTLVNGEYINNLWGVVSGGVPQGRKCSEFTFVSYTNIQYFESLIMSRLNSNRPK